MRNLNFPLRLIQNVFFTGHYSPKIMFRKITFFRFRGQPTLFLQKQFYPKLFITKRLNVSTFGKHDIYQFSN